jgi:hypothetical protein
MVDRPTDIHRVSEREMQARRERERHRQIETDSVQDRNKKKDS